MSTPSKRTRHFVKVDEYSERAAELGEWADEWPAEPPPIVKTSADRLRLELTADPSKVAILNFGFRDPLAAARAARRFVERGNAKLAAGVFGSGLAGEFNARHFWSDRRRAYQIAVRYQSDVTSDK
jgi:FAD/FMN-containing dehydrogenase